MNVCDLCGSSIFFISLIPCYELLPPFSPLLQDWWGSAVSPLPPEIPSCPLETAPSAVPRSTKCQTLSPCLSISETNTATAWFRSPAALTNQQKVADSVAGLPEQPSPCSPGRLAGARCAWPDRRLWLAQPKTFWGWWSPRRTIKPPVVGSTPHYLPLVTKIFNTLNIVKSVAWFHTGALCFWNWHKAMQNLGHLVLV